MLSAASVHGRDCPPPFEGDRACGRPSQCTVTEWRSWASPCNWAAVARHSARKGCSSPVAFRSCRSRKRPVSEANASAKSSGEETAGSQARPSRDSAWLQRRMIRQGVVPLAEVSLRKRRGHHRLGQSSRGPSRAGCQ
eukprot:scaffold942_cov260-Pinguiococcus_pyrenoidosus.AAC.1